MIFKQLIELYDLLDSPSASGAGVVEYLRGIDPACDADTYVLEGPKGSTDMVRVRIPGSRDVYKRQAHRGVPALAVAVSHGGCFLQLVSYQHVDQARLPHAAFADEHGRGVRRHKRAYRFHAGRIVGRHDDGLHVGAGQRAHAIAHRCHFGIAFGAIGFRQHHGHGRARLVSPHQLCLLYTSPLGRQRLIYCK